VLAAFVAALSPIANALHNDKLYASSTTEDDGYTYPKGATEEEIEQIDERELKAWEDTGRPGERDGIGLNNQTRDEIIEDHKNPNMCHGRALIFVPSSLQQLSEDQCFFFNSCLNTGGSILECYNAAKEINCDMYSDKRYYCPPVLLSSE
jgi:hypothetical protein